MWVDRRADTSYASENGSSVPIIQESELLGRTPGGLGCKLAAEDSGKMPQHQDIKKLPSNPHALIDVTRGVTLQVDARQVMLAVANAKQRARAALPRTSAMSHAPLRSKQHRRRPRHVDPTRQHGIPRASASALATPQHGAPTEARNARESILQCRSAGQENGHHARRSRRVRRTRPGAHLGHLLVAREVPTQARRHRDRVRVRVHGHARK
jgi:hypothetical protein